MSGSSYLSSSAGIVQPATPQTKHQAAIPQHSLLKYLAAPAYGLRRFTDGSRATDTSSTGFYSSSTGDERPWVSASGHTGDRDGGVVRRARVLTTTKLLWFLHSSLMVAIILYYLGVKAAPALEKKPGRVGS